MTTDEKRSTNGHVHFEAFAAPAARQRQRERHQSSLGRYLMPAVLVVTALVIFRRLQRGNVI